MALKKPELLAILAEKLGTTKSQADTFLDAFIEIVNDEVWNKGEDLPVTGLGKFSKKTTAAKQGRNPKTGEAMTINEKSRIAFKMAKKA